MGHRIDDTDIELLRLLRRNGRIGNREAGRLLGISEFSVRRRLAALEEAGLIAVGTWMDYKQLGFSTVVFLTIECDLGQVSEIARQLSEQPEIQFLCIATGGFDIVATCICTSENHLFQFLTTCVGRIPGIRKVQTAHVLSEIKHFYQSDPPFDQLKRYGAMPVVASPPIPPRPVDAVES